MKIIENPLSFNELPVRTAVDDQGQTWFCAKDVYEILDIAWSGGAASLKNTPKDWQLVLQLQTSFGVKPTILLSEAGVYQTIFRSSKPIAKEFANWVCGEVLPAIRRQGFYGAMPIQNQIALRRTLLITTSQLIKCNDAFESALLKRQVSDLCSLLGMPTPSLDLLGQRLNQPRLAGV